MSDSLTANKLTIKNRLLYFLKNQGKIVLFIIFLFIFYAFRFPSGAAADTIIGEELIYTVQQSDNLYLISAKLGVSVDRLIKDNNIDLKKILRVGQKLRANTMKIVPYKIDDGIIINIPDRMLYFFQKGALKTAFPVGLGMPSWRGKTQWRTPTGKFEVVSKRKNPTWHVPLSMQRKMALEGEPVKTVVPPGPDNPLGRYAINTTIPGIVIHETIWPESVYRYRSHGCIRVIPQNMEVFFYMVEIKTVGEIIYNPVKIAVTNDFRIYLEVHKDIYGYKKDLMREAKALIGDRGVSHLVDWNKIERVVGEQAGIVEDITL